MTRNELMEKIGKKPNDLINTSLGLLDVLTCDDKTVTYGFLSGREPITEPLSEFLSRFGVFI